VTRDPVTPAIRAAVLERDGRCIRSRMDTGHECRDTWGNPHDSRRLDLLQLDHVQEGYGRMGKRAPSDPAHLVSLCAASHLGGWATANRPALRAYLAALSEERP
jgi:hypothetical protein